MLPRARLFLASIFATSLFLLLIPSSSFAQSNNDFHLTRDRAHAFYVQSVFAHGHRHGYEEGYHAADVDYHMGRDPLATANKLKLPAMVGYKREFGDKSIFRQGYEKGFLAGYADSYSGRDFHDAAESAVSPHESAVSVVASSGVDTKVVPLAPPQSTRAFDFGVVEGYRVAFSIRKDLNQESAPPAPADCNAVRPTDSLEYCAGFAGGFAMGRSDVASQSLFATDSVTRLAKNSR